MRHICSASDIKYLMKGLTLFESLRETSSEPFTLHYLCLDDESFNVVRNIDGILAYRYSISNSLKELRDTDYLLFCYASASVFCDHLLKYYPEITYADSDIFFHKDISKIWTEIGDNSVGIFRHRQFSSPRPEGAFNVGVVYFKADQIGKAVCSWWADAVVSGRYPDYASCGDQKYLDFFPYLCHGKLFVDGHIGHGAPWQWQLYEYVDDDIVWEGERQELIFTHFSQCQFEPFIPSTSHHCYTPPSMYHNPAIKSIYINYYRKMQAVKEKYNL